MIKDMAAILMYTTKGYNHNSTITVHQHDGYDVSCKPRIPTHEVTVFTRLIYSVLSLRDLMTLQTFDFPLGPKKPRNSKY